MTAIVLCLIGIILTAVVVSAATNVAVRKQRRESLLADYLRDMSKRGDKL